MHAGELLHSHTGANKVRQLHWSPDLPILLEDLNDWADRSSMVTCLSQRAQESVYCCKVTSASHLDCFDTHVLMPDGSMSCTPAPDCFGIVQVKLEYYIRMFLEPRERPEQELFPPGSGPAGNWR